MRKRFRKIAVSFLSGALVLSGPASNTAVMTIAAEEVAQDKLTLNEKAVARYSSVRVAFNAADGHTYKVLKKAADGTFTEAVSGLSTGEWIDEAAGTGVIAAYKIVDEADSKETAEFQSAKTGLKAIYDASQIKWADDTIGTENRKVFDGTNTVSLDVSADTIASLKAGTIITKAAWTNTQRNAQAGIIGFSGSAGNAFFGTRNSASDGINRFGVELIDGFKMVATSTDCSYHDGQSHTMAFRSPETISGSEKIAYYFDSTNAYSGMTVLDQSQFEGFISRIGTPNSVTIGAVTPGSNVWKGTIDYVMATTEVLSASEVAKIASEQPVLDLTEPEPAATVELSADGKFSSAVLTWTADGSGPFEIWRDGAKIAETSSKTYTDTTASDAVHTYKIVCGDTASAEVTAGVGLNSAVLYEQLEGDDAKFDGTRVLDLLENADDAKVDEVSAMTQGAVVIRFKDNGASVPYGLFGINKQGGGITNKTGWPSDNPSDTISMYVKADRALRVDIRGGSAKANGSAISGGGWHTIAFIQSTDTSTLGQCRVVLDGRKLFGWTGNANLTDWFASLGGKADRLLIGGVPAADGSFVGGFKGEIEYTAVLDEPITDAEAIELTKNPTLEMFSPMFDAGKDNVWVMTGGAMTDGSLDDLALSRNYVSHFEEVIRWELASDSYDKRQRYVINTGRKNQTIADINNNYKTLVDNMSPKAVAVMLDGNESLSDDEIKSNLKSVIDKNIAANRLTIVQIPPMLSGADHLAELAQGVVDEYKATKKVALFNHDELCGANKASYFTDGVLNADGQLAIGNQLSSMTIGDVTTNTSLMKEPLDALPEVESAQPTAAVTADSVEVTAAGKDGWKAVLEINDQTIEKTIAGSKASFASLPENSDFVLTVEKADGTTRMARVYGTTGASATSAHKTLSAKQQAIVDKFNDKSTPIKWLFMGDSITHGCLWTRGADNAVQVFQKYMHDEASRPDDIIINSGVSGAYITETLTSQQYRYDAFKDADVVTLMLGTNDGGKYSAESFKQNLGSLIDTIEANGSIVVLRMANKTLSKDLSSFAAAVRELAKEKDVIFVDHYNTWETGLNTDTGFISYWNGNDFHPNHRGQLLMAQEILEAMGIDQDSASIPELTYTRQRPQNTSHKDVEPAVNANTLTYDVAALDAVMGSAVGEVVITVSDGTSSVTKTVDRKAASSIGTVTVDLADLNKNSLHAEVKASLASSYATQTKVFDEDLTAAPVTQLTMDAEGFYSKAVIKWQTGQTGAVSVYRDGELLAEVNSGTSYTDTTAEKGEHTYQVKAGDLESETKKVIVGLEGSMIYRALGEDEKNFDGTKVIDLLENADSSLVSKVSNMTDGTIVIKFKDDGTTTPYGLFGINAEGAGVDKANWTETTNNSQGLISMFVKANRSARVDIGGSAAKGIGGTVAAKEWHTIAFSQSADLATGQCRVFLDGVKLFGWSRADLTSWFANLGGNIDRMLIGGIPATDGTFAAGFKGEIAYAAVMNEAVSDDEGAEITAGPVNALNQIFDGRLDRTWVVTGGGLASSDYASTMLSRTYSQIFSETISIDYMGTPNTGVAYNYPNRQRYVINASKPGQTVVDIDAKYDRLIENLDPKAVAVMLDGNDELTSTQITDALKSIIAKNNAKQRVTLIQIPPVQGAPKRDLASLVNTMLAGMDEEEKKAVRVVDHEAQFEGKEDGRFNADGSLNAKGHLLVANQMTNAFADKGFGNSKTVTDSTINKEYAVQPEYTDKTPSVVVAATSVQVSTDAAGSWIAKLTVNGESISRPMTNGSVIFDGLKAGSEFTVSVLAADGSEQLIPMAGTLGTSAVSPVAYYGTLTALQQALKEKVDDKDTPMKWLFTGDSITHGILTHGYSSTMQVFERYIHEDLGRTEDIIVNAGVSNADFENFSANYDQRYSHYKDADVVIVMLGTNDSAYSDTDNRYVNYKQHMTEFIQTCKENGSIVILRNPPLIVQSSHNGHQDRMRNLSVQIREIAQEQNVILADHYAMFTEKAFSDDTTAKRGGTWSDDGIHPEALGQLAMAKQLIQAMGLWDESSMIARTEYKTADTETTDKKSTAPVVDQEADTVTYSVSALETALGKTVGEITLSVTDGTSTIEKKLVRKENASLGSIAVDTADLSGEVTVTVKAVTTDAPHAVKIVYSDKADLGTKEEIIDKTILENILIVKDKSLNKDNYPAEQMAAYQKIADEAEAVIKNPQSQAEVDLMTHKMHQAMLELRLTPDKSKLNW